jgi:hypothetical protein
MFNETKPAVCSGDYEDREMKAFVSYHGDAAVKEKYVARFAKHRALDQVVQGTGFDPGTGRGCFVGCTLNRYDHSAFETELGWPQWLARLADAIFEGLPREEAPQFGTDLLAAVPIGIDLNPIKDRLAVRRIDRLIALQQTNLDKYGQQVDAAIHQVISALNIVRNYHESESGDESAARSAAWSARSAAESAARSAESAARSAAESAARSAESAARSAAWSAESAAESAAYKTERNDLLDLLRIAK